MNSSVKMVTLLLLFSIILVGGYYIRTYNPEYACLDSKIVTNFKFHSGGGWGNDYVAITFTDGTKILKSCKAYKHKNPCKNLETGKVICLEWVKK